MSYTKLFRINTGEEIIASVVHDYVDSIEITDAVVIVYHQVDNDRMSAGFAPFMPYSDGNITLNKNAISSHANVKDQLLAEYNRLFSKIQIVPAGAI